MEAKEAESLSSPEIDVEQSASPREVHGFAWFLIVGSVLSSTFLFGLDTTIVANIQPAVVERFDALSDLPWLFTAFMLGASATNLFWGQVYCHMNTKWTYIGCIALFEAGSAISGAAPTMNAMIVGRAICGAGGAGMYTGVMTFLSVLTTEEERVLYLAIPGLTWGAATVLGPIIGGAFTESGAGWRFAFYLNLFIGAFFAPVTVFLIPSRDPRPGARVLDRMRNLDWLGLVLISGIYVSGLMAISFGGVLYPWNSGRTIGLLVVSGTLTIIYWVQQACCYGVARDCRTIPFEFLRNVTLMYAFLLETCAATAAFVSISFLPLYFQFVRGDSALYAGVRLLPFVIFLVLMIVSNGWIATRIGHMTPLFLLGSALALAGGALMYTVDETTKVAKIYGYTILLGAGAGMYLQLPFAVAQMSTKPALIPVAVGFISWAQLAAPAVTVAISNAIFLNKATTNVAAAIPQASREEVSRIISGVDPAYLGGLSSTVRASIVSGIVKAMRDVYVLVIVAGAISLLATVVLLVRRDKLRRPARALIAA